MKTLLVATAALLATTAFAEAAIPFLNATCPGNISVHADEGGPIYLNGTEGKLKVYNDNAYEATVGDVTVSLTINPDGTPDLAYTGPGRANGICQIESGGAGGDACPADVSEADRSKYPACK
jgi:hypothetical protein